MLNAQRSRRIATLAEQIHETLLSFYKKNGSRREAQSALTIAGKLWARPLIFSAKNPRVYARAHRPS